MWGLRFWKGKCEGFRCVFCFVFLVFGGVVMLLCAIVRGLFCGLVAAFPLRFVLGDLLKGKRHKHALLQVGSEGTRWCCKKNISNAL